jgi:hypothetical protein
MFSSLCAILNYVDIPLALSPGVLMDDAAGLRNTDVVYVDTHPEQFESLPVTALHRPVDLEIVTADKEGRSIP